MIIQKLIYSRVSEQGKQKLYKNWAECSDCLIVSRFIFTADGNNEGTAEVGWRIPRPGNAIVLCMFNYYDCF